jgi:hypothetical protein
MCLFVDSAMQYHFLYFCFSLTQESYFYPKDPKMDKDKINAIN